MYIMAIVSHIATAPLLMNNSPILPCSLTFIILGDHIWSLKYTGECHMLVCVCVYVVDICMSTLSQNKKKSLDHQEIQLALKSVS